MRGRVRWMVSALAAMLTVAPLGGQSGPGSQSATGSGPRDFGGFGGLTLRFGDMRDEFAAFPGAEFAVLLRQRIYLGIAGAGLATDHEIGTGKLDMGYGGALVGYVITTRSLLEVTAQTVVGAGGLRLRPSADEDWDAVFVFEPSAGVELKLAPVARLGLGLGYRFVGGSDSPAAPDEELRGVTGTLTLRLGWF